jgi:polar amino acid transport system substrate-binding protein
MLWMLASLIILTTVTASITTSLTLGRLESKVTGPGDLGKLRVGAVSQTTSEETLREMKLDFRSMPDLHSGLAAICRHELDAMVDDQPMLAMTVEAGYAGCIDVLPHTFHRQDYAFALPTGSALREPINRILASRVATLQSP